MRAEERNSSTRSVPEAQVDDVAIHGDVGAEVVEHRGDVILSGTTRTERRQFQESRERDAHRELTIPIPFPRREGTAGQEQMVTGVLLMLESIMELLLAWIEKQTVKKCIAFM